MAEFTLEQARESIFRPESPHPDPGKGPEDIRSASPEPATITEPKPTLFERARKKADKLRANVEALIPSEIQRPEPLLLWDGHPFLYPKSIVAIQGQRGQHKSRLASAIAAALLSPENAGSLLGFERPLYSPPCQVHYLDTEREEWRLAEAMQNLLRAAGYNPTEPGFTLPANFRVDSFYDQTDKTLCRELIKAFVAEQHAATRGKWHYVLVLDVCTDLIKDFNDIVESGDLLAMCREIINEYDATVILVIHENPTNGGATKARGHAGTELGNKASLQVRIGLHTDGEEPVYEIETLKSSSTARHPKQLVRLDTATGLLCRADGALVATPTLQERIAAILPDVMQPGVAMPRKEVVSKVHAELGESNPDVIDKQLPKIMRGYFHAQGKKWDLTEGEKSKPAGKGRPGQNLVLIERDPI